MNSLVFLRQNHNSAKLNEHDVWLIKGLIYHGLSYSVIAEKFDVTKASISRIATGKIWKHVPEYAE